MKIKRNTLYDCFVIKIDKHHSDVGNITVIENQKNDSLSKPCLLFI
jgi:hypothetical protein